MVLGAPLDFDGDGIESEELVPDGFNLEQEGGEEERTSFFAALQWQTDNLDVNFDFLLSERDQTIDTYGFNFQQLSPNSGTLMNEQINVRGAVDEYFAGTITIPGTNASGFGSGGSSQYNQDTSVDRETMSTGLNVSWSNDLWTVAGDISPFRGRERRTDFQWARCI